MTRGHFGPVLGPGVLLNDMWAFWTLELVGNRKCSSSVANGLELVGNRKCSLSLANGLELNCLPIAKPIELPTNY